MSVAFDADVTLTLSVAFTSDPLDTSPTWKDVSSDLRGLTTFRGRNNFRDVVQTGTASFTLDNTSGAYDPSHTSGVNYPNVLPMRPIRLQAVHDTVTYDLFRGFVQNWNQEYPNQIDAEVRIDCVDAFFFLSMLKATSTESSELSSVRVGNLLDDAGWPAGDRDIGTGDVTMMGYAADCQPVLGLLQQVEKTEGGLFFMAGDGDATFQEQTHRAGLSVTAEFGDSGVTADDLANSVADSTSWSGWVTGRTWTSHGASMDVSATAELPYRDVEISYNMDQVFNKVDVVPYFGLPSTDSDATSITAYGSRLLRIYDTLQNSIPDAEAHAATMLARFKDPKVNVERLSFMPQRLEASLWPRAFDELSTKYTVLRRPPAGNVIEQDVYLEGVRHQADARSKTWTTTFELSQWD